MKDNKPLWLGLALAAIAITVLVVVYANTSRQLTEAENQVRLLQAQLGEKDIQIKGLEERAVIAESKLTLGEEEIKKLRDNIQTLGTCLDGVGQLLASETPAEAFMQFGAIKEPCTKSEAIIDRLRLKQGAMQ